MIERQITWQAALKYSELAQLYKWRPERLPCEQLNHATLLAMTSSLKLREMRDWIKESVGQDYALSAIFGGETVRSKIDLPHLLRFSFMDMETAMLFKLTWV